MTGSKEVAMQIEALFQSLGNTGDEVAEVLREKGIRGKRKDCVNCPLGTVARQKLEEIGGDWNIDIGYLTFTIWKPEAGGIRHAYTGQLSRGCTAFKIDFDLGDYDFLAVEA